MHRNVFLHALFACLGLLFSTFGSAGTETGFLQIVAEPEVDVFVDGTFMGATTRQQEGLILTDVPAGVRTLSFRKGNVEFEDTVRIDAGRVSLYELTEFMPTLEIFEEGDEGRSARQPTTGTLIIQCLPIQCVIDLPEYGLHGYLKTRDRFVADGLETGLNRGRVSVGDRTVPFEFQLCAGGTTTVFASFVSETPSLSITADLMWPECGAPYRLREAPTAPHVPSRDTPTFITPTAQPSTQVATDASISVAPLTVQVAPGDDVEFVATLRGFQDDSVRWQSSGGRIEGSGLVVTYVAPSTPGTYLVWVRSKVDHQRAITARVEVTDESHAPPSTVPEDVPPAYQPERHQPSVPEQPNEQDDDKTKQPTTAPPPEHKSDTDASASEPSPNDEETTDDRESLPTRETTDAVQSRVVAPEDFSYVRFRNAQLRSVQGEGTHSLSFDLSWPLSWRGPETPRFVEANDNYDAAWVFAKYRTEGSGWQHVELASTGHIAPTNIVIDVSQDRTGAFIYRREPGYGPLEARNIQLALGAEHEAVATENTEYKLFAIEMVFVPEGPYFLGSGGDAAGEFRAGMSDEPYLVDSAEAIVLGDEESQLNWSPDQRTGRPSGTLTREFPTGFNDFYMMKYPLKQGQYAAFLDTLTPGQRAARVVPTPDGESRFSLGQTADGTYAAGLPFVPMTHMTWSDAAAFAAWAALRPMTELEYEKASRGSNEPTPGEFAWGTAQATLAEAMTDEGSAREQVLPSEANANAAHSLSGPVRAGAFAVPTWSREQIGSSYYGVLQLSGNVWERVISVGSADGRDFTGLHGAGQVTDNGHADVTGWPGERGRGTGFRGGSWVSDEHFLRTSDRTFAALDNPARDSSIGWRGVR